MLDTGLPRSTRSPGSMSGRRHRGCRERGRARPRTSAKRVKVLPADRPARPTELVAVEGQRKRGRTGTRQSARPLPRRSKARRDGRPRSRPGQDGVRDLYSPTFGYRRLQDLAAQGTRGRRSPNRRKSRSPAPSAIRYGLGAGEGAGLPGPPRQCLRMSSAVAALGRSWGSSFQLPKAPRLGLKD